jgi:hypothetical protein
MGGPNILAGQKLSVGKTYLRTKPIRGLNLTVDRKPFKRTKPIVRTKKSTA